jgi:hypothetical protein
MNKLAKVKSHLRAQLSEEICKPITDHKSYVEVRDSIELLVSMIEMIYCLPYKYKDHTTAIWFIDAQSERINAQHTCIIFQRRGPARNDSDPTFCTCGVRGWQDIGP